MIPEAVIPVSNEEVLMTIQGEWATKSDMERFLREQGKRLTAIEQGMQENARKLESFLKGGRAGQGREKAPSPVARKCNKCAKIHEIFECQRMSGRDKMGLALARNRCLLCLKPHKGICRTPQKCETCGESHHTMLHPE
ncbi:hypothetical protein B9Z55_011026 [Caenorhabditis nigoni]|uniref:Uncharacterized protein n=1 Tax=Caenorhabditis nigoni TaxID=1611254 RepID=A0A2G5UIA1_9PELO|nr:hypothetical protein B9Z55_011026 [Caenorhabditis nigoni]